MFSALKNGHNSRVIQRSRRLSFALEALDRALACGPAGQNHLDRDRPRQANLPRLVDDTHASMANPLQKIEIAHAWRGRCAGVRRQDRGCRGGDCVHVCMLRITPRLLAEYLLDRLRIAGESQPVFFQSRRLATAASHFELSAKKPLEELGSFRSGNIAQVLFNLRSGPQSPSIFKAYAKFLNRGAQSPCFGIVRH
jgi:hypothetical protein